MGPVDLSVHGQERKQGDRKGQQRFKNTVLVKTLCPVFLFF